MIIYANEYLSWREQLIDLREGYETSDKELLKFAKTQIHWTIREKEEKDNATRRENEPIT